MSVDKSIKEVVEQESLSLKRLSRQRDHDTSRSYSIVSLFSGCGGFDLGFIGKFNALGNYYPKLPFNIVWSNDNDKRACLTYQKNFQKEIVCEDIRNILDLEFIDFVGSNLPSQADIVLGGFPCQDFSVAGKRKGFRSQRGTLYKSMVEVVRRTKPLIFVAENVKGLMSIDGALAKIKSDFESIGYNVNYKLFHVANFGIPENRERVIIIGTSKQKQLPIFEFPKNMIAKDEWVSSVEAIGDLENVAEGKVQNHFWSKAKKFAGTQGNKRINRNGLAPTIRAEHHGNIEFHWNGKRRLSAREVARIQSFPDDFIFYPSTSAAYKQIGNAVPPIFAWHLAVSVDKFLNKYLI